MLGRDLDARPRGALMRCSVVTMIQDLQIHIIFPCNSFLNSGRVDYSICAPLRNQSTASHINKRTSGNHPVRQMRHLESDGYLHCLHIIHHPSVCLHSARSSLQSACLEIHHRANHTRLGSQNVTFHVSCFDVRTRQGAEISLIAIVVAIGNQRGKCLPTSIVVNRLSIN